MSILSLVTNEKQTLNCLIQQPELADKFEENFFISDLGKDLFATVKELHAKGLEPTDVHMVSEGNKLNPNITLELVGQLKAESFDPLAFDKYYFPRLKKDYAKNRIETQLLQETLIETSKKGELDVGKIEGLVQEIEKSLQLILGRDSSLVTTTQMIDRYVQTLYRRKRGDYIFPTGDSFLDKYVFMGFPPGMQTTIVAATGVGKSIFALNLVNKQINKRIPSMYVSLEMDLIPTMDRLIALRNQLPVELFYPDSESEIADYAFSILEQERDSLGKSKNFFFIEESNISIDDLERLVIEAKKRMGVDYLIVTLDLLTMLTDFSGADAKQYEDAMNRLHILCRKHKIHLCNVVQSNRNADSARIFSLDQLHRLRPLVNHVKNSNAIAERSRLVLGLFRPKYFARRLFPNAPELETMDDTMEVQILKQNMGRVGLILRYLFTPEFYSMFPLPDEVSDGDPQGSTGENPQESQNS